MRRRTSFALLIFLAVPHPVSALDEEAHRFFQAPAQLALDVYRWIGPSKGTSCPMTPSDSAYARQALARYGLWGGLWRTADRLHRCGHDLSDYPIVPRPEGLRFDDPLPRQDR